MLGDFRTSKLIVSNKQEMRQTINLLLGLLLLTVTSCSSRIQIVNYIDINSPLTLTVNIFNDKTRLTQSDRKTIEPQSEKFNKLVNWCNNNSSNWKSTFASYYAKVSVTQKNFRLLYLQDGVVIGFAGNDGKPKQYSKTIRKGELDFLMDEGK
jgi:hypothetical protein